MQKFVRNLLTEWRSLDLPFSGELIIIAVSGGADSVSLAFAVKDLVKRKKLANEFLIAHFNHNLRGEESKIDADFVRDSAENLEFEFISGSAQDKPESNQNLEQWARNERYKFLLNTAVKRNSKIVLTAHTLDDQAETFLLNLIRGSGLEGLSAMKPIRKLNESSEILLARPMLNWAQKQTIEKFAKTNRIKFRNDSMNDDLSFKRVKIRKELIPILKDYNPQIISALTNTARIIGYETELLDEVFNENYFELQGTSESALSLKRLRTFSKPMLYRVLRIWLKSRRGSLRKLDFKNIEAIESLINSKKSGKFIELPGLGRVIKGNGKIVFEDIKVEK